MTEVHDPSFKNRFSPSQPTVAVLTDETLIDERFEILRSLLYTHFIAGQPTRFHSPIFYEFGRVQESRLYFYLRPLNARGFLFERSGAGWIVTLSEKITTQDTFLRPWGTWDQVVLYHSVKEPHLIKIQSHLLTTQYLTSLHSTPDLNTYLSFSYYCELIKKILENKIQSPAQDLDPLVRF